MNTQKIWMNFNKKISRHVASRCDFYMEKKHKKCDRSIATKLSHQNHVEWVKIRFNEDIKAIWHSKKVKQTFPPSSDTSIEAFFGSGIHRSQFSTRYERKCINSNKYWLAWDQYLFKHKWMFLVLQKSSLLAHRVENASQLNQLLQINIFNYIW